MKIQCDWIVLKRLSSLKVKPLGSASDIGKFATSDTEGAAADLDARIATHNVRVSGLAADLLTLAKGGDASEGLSVSRQTLAAAAIGLVEEKVALLGTLQGEFATWQTAARQALVTAEAAAEVTALEIFPPGTFAALEKRESIHASLCAAERTAVLLNPTVLQSDFSTELALAKIASGISTLDGFGLAGCIELPQTIEV